MYCVVRSYSSAVSSAKAIAMFGCGNQLVERMALSCRFCLLDDPKHRVPVANQPEIFVARTRVIREQRMGQDSDGTPGTFASGIFPAAALDGVDLLVSGSTLVGHPGIRPADIGFFFSDWVYNVNKFASRVSYSN